MSDAPDWLERNLAAAKRPRTLTDDERRCVEVLSSIARLYNLITPGPLTHMISFNSGTVSVLLQGELATYDDSALTRLVIASHVHSVRVAISPWVSCLDERRARIIAQDFLAEYECEIDWETIPGILEVRLSPRSAGVTDQCWDGHPTAENLAGFLGAAGGIDE